MGRTRAQGACVTARLRQGSFERPISPAITHNRACRASRRHRVRGERQRQATRERWCHACYPRLPQSMHGHGG